MVDSDFLVEQAKVGSWQGLADSSSRPGFSDRDSDKDSHILDNLPDPVLPPQAPDPLIILETAAPVVKDAAPLSVLTLPTFRAMPTNSVNKIKGTRKMVPASSGAIAKPSAPKTIGKKRVRRKASEIERKFVCTVPGCLKRYGSEDSLKLHSKRKHEMILESTSRFCGYETLPRKCGPSPLK